MTTTAHLQQQILDALAATLAAADTAAGSRIYVDHPDELTAPMLPAIVLAAGDEQLEATTVHLHALQQRLLDLEIIALCAGPGAFAQARDLVREIEVAIFATAASATCGGKCANLTLERLSPAQTGSASQLMAEIRGAWRCTYYTAAGTPTANA